MYNRYLGNTGRYERVTEAPVRRIANSHGAPPPARHAELVNVGAERQKPPPIGGGGLGNIFKSLNLNFLNINLPFGLDLGDIMLLLILFLLYLDTKDDEFLIILVFMGFNLFKKT